MERFKDKIGANMLLTAIINLIFLIFVTSFVLLSITVIHPVIPNFTGAQVVTDNIIFGVIAGLFLFFIAFFAKLNASAAVITCHGPRSSKIGIGLACKVLLRRSFAVFSLTVAQSLVVLITTAAFLLILVNNLANFAISATLLFALAILLIFYKTLTFFAITLAVTQKRYFFGAVWASAKLVFERGFWRILAITFSVTVLNILAFLLIFLMVDSVLASQNILGEPNLMALYMRFFNPMQYISIIIACVPMLFIAPRLSLVALSIYSPPEKITPRAGLGSRSLAVLVDLLILSAGFAMLYTLALRILDIRFELAMVNIGVAAVIILAIFIMFAVYNIFFETAFSGQTPGKKLMSLRVTMENGEPIRLLQSILRNVLRIIDLVSFVMIIFEKKHHRLGDVLSNTKVCFDNLEEEVEVDV